MHRWPHLLALPRNSALWAVNGIVGVSTAVGITVGSGPFELVDPDDSVVAQLRGRRGCTTVARTEIHHPVPRDRLRINTLDTVEQGTE